MVVKKMKFIIISDALAMDYCVLKNERANFTSLGVLEVFMRFLILLTSWLYTWIL